jgi:hypothetical protein
MALFVATAIITDMGGLTYRVRLKTAVSWFSVFVDGVRLADALIMSSITGLSALGSYLSRPLSVGYAAVDEYTQIE